jgi:hypothetical protein
MLLLTLAAAVAGCGGGGGGGSAPAPPAAQQPPPGPTPPQRPPPPVISYTGRSEPAVIDESNAKSLTAKPVHAINTVASLVAIFSLRVPEGFQGVLEATAQGPQGGQGVLRGVLERGSGPTSTGWLWMEFDDYTDGAYVLDGRVVQDVRAPITPLSHSIRLELSDLRITEPHATHVLNGIVESVRLNDFSGNRLTMTANLVETIVGTGEQIWAENIVGFRERTASHYAFDQTYSGRIYDSVHGHVDVASDAAFTFIGDEPLPDRGGPMRVHGASGSAGLFALNTEYGALVLDDDGDGDDDRFARLRWSEVLRDSVATNTNSAAIANAGARRYVTIGETVELNGLLSHDLDASFLTVDWTLAVKPAGSAAVLDVAKRLTPSFTPDLPGYYVLTLEVNDPDGDAYDSVVLQALPPNPNSPTPSDGVQVRVDRPRSVPLGTTVSVDASSSSRSISGPLAVLHSWTLGVPPGSNAALAALTTPTSSFVPDVAGFYRIRVENGVPSTSHQSEISKVVGFGTGFQYFESAPLTLQASLSGDPVFVDLDGDGSQDVASLGGSTGWAIVVWRGDGRGSIAPAAEFPVDNSVQQLLHGDLDGDGLDDLVTLGLDTLYALYSRKPMSSSILRTIALDRGPDCGFGYSQWATLADGDKDGRAELLVADRCRLAMLTWRHGAGGTLSPDREQAIPELRSLPVVFGDLTDDGRVDFVVPRDALSPQDALLVFTQSANGSFALRQTLEGTGSPAMAVGDVTGDGRGDLVVVREPVLSVLAQQSNGTLASATNYSVGRIAPLPPRFADLNGDGRTDLVTVRERDDLLLALQQPQGSLAFVTLWDTLEQRSDTAAVPVDWNGDGRIDLVRQRHVMSDVGFSVRLRMP